MSEKPPMNSSGYEGDDINLSKSEIEAKDEILKSKAIEEKYGGPENNEEELEHLKLDRAAARAQLTIAKNEGDLDKMQHWAEVATVLDKIIKSSEIQKKIIDEGGLSPDKPDQPIISGAERGSLEEVVSLGPERFIIEEEKADSEVEDEEEIMQNIENNQIEEEERAPSVKEVVDVDDDVEELLIPRKEKENKKKTKENSEVNVDYIANDEKFMDFISGKEGDIRDIFDQILPGADEESMKEIGKRFSELMDKNPKFAKDLYEGVKKYERVSQRGEVLEERLNKLTDGRHFTKDKIEKLRQDKADAAYADYYLEAGAGFLGTRSYVEKFKNFLFNRKHIKDIKEWLKRDDLTDEQKEFWQGKLDEYEPVRKKKEELGRAGYKLSVPFWSNQFSNKMLDIEDKIDKAEKAGPMSDERENVLESIDKLKELMIRTLNNTISLHEIAKDQLKRNIFSDIEKGGVEDIEKALSKLDKLMPNQAEELSSKIIERMGVLAAEAIGESLEDSRTLNAIEEKLEDILKVASANEELGEVVIDSLSYGLDKIKDRAQLISVKILIKKLKRGHKYE